MFNYLIGRLIDDVVDRRRRGRTPKPGPIVGIPFDASADLAEIASLIKSHHQAWTAFPLSEEGALAELCLQLAKDAIEACELTEDKIPVIPFARCALALFALEPGFLPFSMPPNIANLSPLERGELVEELHHCNSVLGDEASQQAAIDLVFRVLTGVLETLPDSEPTDKETDTAIATVELLSLIADPHDLISRLTAHLLSNQDMLDNNLFAPLVRQLYRNMLEASGVIIDPDLPLFANDTRKAKLATDYTHESAATVAERYLKNTPLLELLNAPIPFYLPEKTRFEHMHILAGTGHGKTQTLQHLIVSDLQRPADQVPSMVILDSQGDMLNILKRLSLFDPALEPSLARRLLIVDPSDVHFAPALNLFDIQSDRLKDYNQRDREQVLAGIIEIYEYIFGGLLGAELTQKQAMVFGFLAELMLAIDSATIHTLRDLLIDASPFMEHIASLPATARGFFETQFFEKGYNATREQILRRLYGVLQNPSFERMFASPQNRLDLFDVLNNGGIVLVNTAKDFMKTKSSSMFGRYIIALTFKAAMERAILPHHQRRPTYLWIDEASEYFDDNIDNLLIQARKFKLGVIMAHQHLGQLPRGLPASLMTNTSIKLAGGVSDRDARIMAPEMRTSPDFLTAMSKERNQTGFAAFVRNVTPQALKLTIPFGTAENLPRMPDESFEILLNASRTRLSPTRIENLGEKVADETTAPGATQKKGPPPAPTKTPRVSPPPATTTIPLPDDDELWEEY